MHRTSALLLAAAAFATPAFAHAQEETICAGVSLQFARPAIAEWTYWLGAGGGWGALGSLSERAVADLRLGGGVDFSLTREGRGDDSAREGAEYQYGGPVEVRLGPWVQAATHIDDVILEGGAMFDVGQTSHASWGTFGMRVGVGAQGLDARGFRVAGSLTLTWGIRYARERYSDGGACVQHDGSRTIEGRGTPTQDHGFVTGIRLFGTARVDADEVYSLVFGVEFEPTFFFPPYDNDLRWIGTR